MSKYKRQQKRLLQRKPALPTNNNVTLLRHQSGDGKNFPVAALESYRRGVRLREAGNAAGAITAFRESLLSAPEFVDVLNELGLVLARQNMHAEALDAFSRVLKIQPQNTVALNNLGALWLKLGNYSEAIQHLEQALESSPGTPEIRANLEIARREQAAAGRKLVNTTESPVETAIRQTITLCLIAKNEAANLPRLFESMQGAVDETVVVDTGSTDDTIAVAESYKAKVVQFPWRNDFAAAKNEALRHATGDWVVFLDADMALEKGHAQKIRQAAASGGAQAYYININSPLPDGMSEDIIAQPWLFRHTPGVRFEGAIHETVFESLVACGFQPMHTDIVVYHFGYSSRNAIVPRFERNLAALRKQIASGQAKPIAYYYLGTTLLGLNRPAEAIPELKKAMAHPDLYWRVRANAHLALIRAYAANGEPEAAEQCADEAVTLYPKDRMTWTFRGQVALQMKNYSKAIESLSQALKLREVLGAEANVQRVNDAGLERELGEALARAGRCAEAAAHYECALADSLPRARAEAVHGLLAFLYHAQGKLDSARAHTVVPFDEDIWDGIEPVAAASGSTARVKDFCRWLESIGRATDPARVRLGLPVREPTTYVDSLLQSARGLREAGMLAQSLIKLERAAALTPSRSGVHYELGATYALAGDRLRAARAYVTELALSPNHAPSAHDIGVLYAQEGDFGEAISWFELALKLDPGNDLARRHATEARERLVAQNA